MPTAIVDTGVWYAMFDPQDAFHKQVEDKSERLRFFTVAVPWPISYELMRSRFVKNSLAVRRFEQFLTGPNIRFVGDEPYRRSALDLAFDYALRRKRPLSMVDCLIRLMIDDPKMRINFLATFNNRDFIDLCGKNRRIELF